MVALICFVLAVLASPFKSKSRLEAENAVLRHQLIVLQRKVRGRAHLTNNDRWFFVAPDSKIIRRLLQLRQNASVFAQGCADFSSDSSDRKHSFKPDSWRASPSLRPDLNFRYTQQPERSRSALPLRQLSRFCYLINSDMVFG